MTSHPIDDHGSPQATGEHAPAPWRGARPRPEALETALCGLLSAQAGGEAEQLLLAAVEEVLGARWVAYYRGSGGVLACRVVRAGEQSRIAPVLPPGLVRLLASGAPRALACRRVKGAGSFVPAAEALVALDLADGERGCLLLGPRAHGAEWDAPSLEVARQIGLFGGIALRNGARLDRLRSLVLVDFLTGCYNRRGFDEHFRLEMGRARRYERPLSLVLLDVDHFKRINDGLGHQTGDLVLRRVGHLLSRAFRTTDCVCRYGGDEFALIFPETPREEAVRLAERLRVETARLFPDESVPLPVTVSFGVVAFPDDATEADVLVRAADRALYRAKASGRDRVCAG